MFAALSTLMSVHTGAHGCVHMRSDSCGHQGRDKAMPPSWQLPAVGWTSSPGVEAGPSFCLLWRLGLPPSGLFKSKG